jgi:hypothetical protein
MALMKLSSISFDKEPFNPLDDMEDLLGASNYKFDRETYNRLSFTCDTNLSSYLMVLEWHADHESIRFSIVMRDARHIDREQMDLALEKANAVAWHGFFVMDGVGHVIFKSLVPMKDHDDNLAFIEALENKIDHGIEEVERLGISLNLHESESSEDLFGVDNDEKVENLILMFSDTKGNA